MAGAGRTKRVWTEIHSRGPSVLLVWMHQKAASSWPMHRCVAHPVAQQSGHDLHLLEHALADKIDHCVARQTAAMCFRLANTGPWCQADARADRPLPADGAGPPPDELGGRRPPHGADTVGNKPAASARSGRT